MLVPVAALAWFWSLSIEVVVIAVVCLVIYAAIAWKKALDDKEIAWARERAAAMISLVRAG